jgi:toxin YoeB
VVGVWRILFTPQAQKDARKIDQAGLRERVQKMLDGLNENPYQPPYEKLIGYLAGAHSKRINLKHRLIFQILDSEKVVKVIRMWTYYE